MNTNLKNTLVAMATASLGLAATACGGGEETDSAESEITAGGEAEASCATDAVEGAQDTANDAVDTATDAVDGVTGGGDEAACGGADEGEAGCGEGSCG